MARFDLPSEATKTLLASAARTTTQTTDWIANHEADGLLLSVVISAVTATPALTPKIQYSPDGGTTAIDYCVITTPLAATGNAAYLVYPGILASADGAMTESFNLPLPRLWRLVVTAGDTDSATYAVHAQFL